VTPEHRIIYNLTSCVLSTPTYGLNRVDLWELLDRSMTYASSVDDDKLEILAHNSHVHENGFTKLTLFDAVNGRYRIRLHIWDPKDSTKEEVNVHDHRYDFVSLVVTGRLENTRWNFSENGAVYKLFAYEPRDEAGRYHLRMVGRYCLSPEPLKIYSAGDAYSMMRDDLHTTQTSDNVRSITLCIQDRNNLKSQARTLSVSHPGDREIMSAPPLEMGRYRKAIRTIYEEEIRPIVQDYRE
jgi:hypothetical protein